jgi:hypothetical protein
MFHPLPHIQKSIRTQIKQKLSDTFFEVDVCFPEFSPSPSTYKHCTSENGSFQPQVRFGMHMQPDMVRQPIYGPERGKSFHQTRTKWCLPEVPPDERNHLVFKMCIF